MKEVLARAQALSDQLIAWRREIHHCPELGFDLPKTAALVKRQLESFGYKTASLCEGSVVAVLEGGHPGKTILLRADMDAVPTSEENDLPFRSPYPDRAHVCGHDIHTSMLLGAAKLLMEDRASLCGRIKFVFQPNEEGPGGALKLVENGILENPAVDCALGFHTDIGKELLSGQVGYHNGPMMASTDVIKITAIGRGAHGARPEEGLDPIYMLYRIYGELQAIRTHETPQQQPVVLTMGTLEAGTAANTIPDTASMSGTLRTFDDGLRTKIKRRIAEISQGVAHTLGGEARVEFLAGAAPTINDRKLHDELLGYMEELLGPDRLVSRAAVMGSEDFAEYSVRVPSAFYWLGFGGSAEGYRYSVHASKAEFDESVMPLGTALFVQCASRWLSENRNCPHSA